MGPLLMTAVEGDLTEHALVAPRIGSPSASKPTS